MYKLVLVANNVRQLKFYSGAQTPKDEGNLGYEDLDLLLACPVTVKLLNFWRSSFEGLDNSELCRL